MRGEGPSCSGHFSLPSSFLGLLLSLLNLYLVASLENLDCSLHSFDPKGEHLIHVCFSIFSISLPSLIG